MKRLVFIIAIFGIVTTSCFATQASQEQKEAAKQMIKLYGYSCSYVNSMYPFLMSEGYNVYCNGFRYSYEIVNKGGKWSVIVK